LGKHEATWANKTSTSRAGIFADRQSLRQGGSCAEYLHNTIVDLHAHGIRDRNLWRLQELVAAEIIACQNA